MLHAVTAISGSGPAYAFRPVEALQQAAREPGSTGEDARRLSLPTFQDSSQLAASSDAEVSMLRAPVTSKNGTTERTLSSMEANRIKQHFIAAAHAWEICAELGSKTAVNQ